MPLPRYISQGGIQVYAQPFTAQRVRQYGFLLPADSAAIQRNFIDPCLNAPTGGKLDFHAVMPAVFLSFTRIDAIFSDAPVYREYGYYKEQETTFLVLMEEKNSQRLYWGMPYIFVNNPLAIAMGREVYGFPKELGWFDIPEDPRHANLFTMDAIAIQNYNPHAEGARQRLIEVERTFTDPHAPTGDTLLSIEEMLGEMRNVYLQHGSLQNDLLLALHSAEDTLRGRVPIALLKQFRDSTDGTFACYQAIVEADIDITHFYGGFFLPNDYQVTITPYDSHPIQRDLGLPTGPIKPLLSISSYYDFNLPPGKILWQAHG